MITQLNPNSLTAVLAQRLMSGVGVARRTPRQGAALITQLNPDNPTAVFAQHPMTGGGRGAQDAQAVGCR